MTKLIGLALVFSCGPFLGWGRAAKLEGEVRRIGLWRDFLRQFAVCLETTRAAPGQIVRMIAKGSAFTDNEAMQAMSASFSESGSFARAVSRALEGRGKPGAVEEILLTLGEAVGVKPLEEQLSALKSAELLLEREWERAREQSRRYGGLSRRLGVLLGLLAVVILA